ncbi:MAG: DUF3179 domain-containing protein [Pseudorhodobacter sp.]|nr:DUF3179 domain-containing protein [Pseudorhodobacter sp.]
MKQLLLAAMTLTFASLALAETPSAAWLREWPDTDFSRSAVAFSEILSGGPPKDGIAAIDEPMFSKVARVKPMPAASDPVLSVEIAGEARAYPLSVLIWHEIVNDTLAGVPIAITYCPLCNSGIVFDRRVQGEQTTFGTTGKLRNSDLVMYDRATESWWQQFDGQAILGARLGTTLKTVPSRLESWAEFVARNPHGLVLVPEQPQTRSYGRTPYVGYDSSTRPFLYDGSYDGPGEPLMRVVAIEGVNAAWSFDFIRNAGPLRVGDLEISWRAGQASALDAAQIRDGRDVGSVLVERLHKDGSRALVVYSVPFAFAFAAFHPGATIHHD